MGKLYLHIWAVKWSWAATLEPLIVMKHIKRVICKRCAVMTQMCPALQQWCCSSPARSQALQSRAEAWEASGRVLCPTGLAASCPAPLPYRFLWHGATEGPGRACTAASPCMYPTAPYGKQGEEINVLTDFQKEHLRSGDQWARESPP